MMEIKEAIEILEKIFQHYRANDKPPLDYRQEVETLSFVLSFLSKINDAEMPKKKEEINITKKMCFGSEFPSECYYDKPHPRGDTCLMQDREIPKEKCSDYRDMQVVYDNFEEWNACHDDFLAYHLKKMGERVNVEEIIEILKLYQGGSELHIATEWSFKDLAQAIAKEIGKE